MSLIALRFFFQNSPINSAVLTGNGKMVKPRWNLNKTTKECTAPQSKATLLLTPFSTHLSFRWTLPLNNICRKKCFHKKHDIIFYFKKIQLKSKRHLLNFRTVDHAARGNYAKTTRGMTSRDVMIHCAAKQRLELSWRKSVFPFTHEPVEEFAQNICHPPNVLFTCAGHVHEPHVHDPACVCVWATVKKNARI
jgi:hypothetical protein